MPIDNIEEIEKAKEKLKNYNLYIDIKPKSARCISCITEKRMNYIEAEVIIDDSLDYSIKEILEYIQKLEKQVSDLKQHQCSKELTGYCRKGLIEQQEYDFCRQKMLEDKVKENKKLQEKIEKINQFLSKNTIEQIRILLAKYWLTHTNDQVFETWGFNYVPTEEYQKKARKILEIEELNICDSLNAKMLQNMDMKNILRGATKFNIGGEL